MVKKYMKMVKGTVGLGVGSMAGLGVIGSMGSIPGMPAGTGAITGAVGSGLTLANVGNLANIGMNIMPKIKKGKYKDCRMGNSSKNNNVVKNILGK